MEIIGLGTDLVECVRVRAMIERHGEQFLRRVYTPREVRACRSKSRSTEAFAGLWAAKEAVLKTLGFSSRNAPHRSDVEILGGRPGPKAELTGAVRERAEALGVTSVILSLAADRHYAAATAIALR